MSEPNGATMNDVPLEEAELAAYQEALVETLLLALPPDEQLRRLAADPRTQPFADYVRSFDRRCLEAMSLLMRRWGDRR
jgi:hypothetical protein